MSDTVEQAGSVDTAYEDEAALSDVLATYGRPSHDPDTVTEVFREIWRVRGKRAGQEIEVAPCPYSRQELEELGDADRRVGYLPPHLATQAGRPLLASVFPAIDDFALSSSGTRTTEEFR